jgi:hypothetical protein
MNKIYKSLLAIQVELKAPKNQYNSFGKYNYRSCEDILEALKPLCQKNNVVLTLFDEIVEVGGRVYVKATAMVEGTEDGATKSCTAWARESKEKKGMDEAQITGAASSYARKYALNGLFAIDDTKDADTMKPETKPTASKKVTYPFQQSFTKARQALGDDIFFDICTTYGLKSVEDWKEVKEDQREEFLDKCRKQVKKGKS